MIVSNLQTIIERYGLLAVFAGTFMEGETVLITAAILAGQGLFKPGAVCLSAFLGALSGHMSCFLLGRILRNRPNLVKIEKFQKRITRVNKIILKHPKKAVIILQYLYGMRVFGAIAIGMSGLSLVRFLLYESLNCMVWAVIVFMTGYTLGVSFMYIFHGWLRWVWLGISVLLLALFFHHIGKLSTMDEVKINTAAN